MGMNRGNSKEEIARRYSDHITEMLPFDLTPEEIAARAAEIRAEWPPEEELRRRAGPGGIYGKTDPPSPSIRQVKALTIRRRNLAPGSHD